MKTMGDMYGSVKAAVDVVKEGSVLQRAQGLGRGLRDAGGDVLDAVIEAPSVPESIFGIVPNGLSLASQQPTIEKMFQPPGTVPDATQDGASAVGVVGNEVFSVAW
ncbi:hypothetical protein AFB00_20335 [Pseudonocardia sp. HH130630-07]|nr:hypothetical protein AFB00_20335 [Pseudonocardia sp. HH130630-07]